MKKLYLSAALLLLLAAGCKEITTETTICRDGSCLRTVTIRQGGSESETAAYPFPSDSSWRITVVPDSTDKDKVISRAERLFPDVAALREWYAARDTGDVRISISVDLEKKFRWFYTYFVYRETWNRLNPFPPVPVANYLTQEEMKLHFEGADNTDEDIDPAALDFTQPRRAAVDTATIDERFNAWMIRSVFESCFQSLLEAAGKLTDSALAEHARQGKERFFTAFLKEMDGETDEKSLVRAAAASLDDPDVYRISETLEETYRRVEHQYLLLNDALDDSYTARVTMPGLFLDANCDGVMGDVAEWKINPDRFLLSDYEMKAESRLINIWAVAVSGIVVLALLVLLLVPLFRKK
ncbi:hypothetical protein JXO52_02640 [bacterium]|nr:hypothetical protein [bacterium]